MIRTNLDFRGLLKLKKLTGGYFITTIINQSIPFLVLPIITRYLTPAEYGSLALFNFYLAISYALAGHAVPNVVSKHFYSTDKKNISEIIGNSIVLVGLLSFLVLMFVVIAYPWLQIYLNIPFLWLVLIPIASFSHIVFAIGLTVFRNLRKVALFSKYKILNTILNITISLFFIIVLLWGWQGRAFGIVLSFVISALLSFWYLKKNDYISFAISRNVISKILNVLIPLIPNSFQSVMISQVGIFFIQYYFTKDLLGLYSIGYQVSTVIKLLISTLSMSWFPYLYAQISKKEMKNKLFITRMLFSIYCIVFAGVVFINLTAGYILKIMTTPAFFGAIEFIPWFTIGFMFYGYYVLLMPILIMHNQQKYISLVSFTNMIAMVIFIFLFIELFGYIGVAYAFSITYFLMFIAFFWKVQRVMPLPWVRALKIWN